MKVIVCTGDSHTWGQGAKGINMEDMPDLFGSEGVCAGDLRPIPFDRTECYVARIREALAGEAEEFSARRIAKLDSLPVEDGCALIRGTFGMTVSGGLVRLFFKKETGDSTARVALDGKAVWKDALDTDEPAWNGRGVKAVCARCNDGGHMLTVTAERAHLYRVEVYGGTFAVINAGVGSCAAREYLDVYWNDYVAACRPDIVLAEAHTINDWLRPNPPEYSADAMRALIDETRALGAKPIVMTVSPILGSQNNAWTGLPYDDYIEASRQAARDRNTPLVDANAAMEAALRDMTEEERSAYFYSDGWHVNSLGHGMYARLALDELKKCTE